MKMSLGWSAGKFVAPTVLFLAGILAIANPQSASAHASLVRATPAAGAAVKAPNHIDLWFNELLEDGFNFVTVTPVSSEKAVVAAVGTVNLARSAPVVDRRDRTHLSVVIDPLPVGTYVVQWRVLSLDGHSAPGQFTFRVIGS